MSNKSQIPNVPTLTAYESVGE